jgi:hypothetical protein
MSEKQVGKIQHRRSRAEVDRLVAEYEASGLSRQEFCLKHGLALATLDRYRKGRRQGHEPSSGNNRLIKVELSGTQQVDGRGQGSELAVVLSSGRRIQVRRGFDANMLGQLVRVLEQV